MTQPVLDAVLVNFLNDKKVEKPAAHAPARSLLAKRADELNGCAVPLPRRAPRPPPAPHRRRPPSPPSPSLLGAAPPQLLPHVHPVVVVPRRRVGAPGALAHPPRRGGGGGARASRAGQQLVDLLKFDDASVRETGAALFADLAQEPAYYQKFPQLFDPFAAVFRDVSPACAKMVEHGVRLAHPPEAAAAAGESRGAARREAQGRLRPRRQGAHDGGEGGVRRVLGVDRPVRAAVAAARERMRDKKSQVAGVAMEQMVTLYRHHAVAAAGGGNVPSRWRRCRRPPRRVPLEYVRP